MKSISLEGPEATVAEQSATRFVFSNVHNEQSKASVRLETLLRRCRRAAYTLQGKDARLAVGVK